MTRPLAFVVCMGLVALACGEVADERPDAASDAGVDGDAAIERNDEDAPTCDPSRSYCPTWGPNATCIEGRCCVGQGFTCACGDLVGGCPRDSYCCLNFRDEFVCTTTGFECFN